MSANQNTQTSDHSSKQSRRPAKDETMGRDKTKLGNQPASKKRTTLDDDENYGDASKSKNT